MPVETPDDGPRGPWRPIGWIFGLAVLGTVITVALHFTEEGRIVALAEAARPSWLLVALALQLVTYFLQGEVFRVVGTASGHRIGRGVLYRLSLAKLFIDQAIPSTGLSGTYVFAEGLQAKGTPRRVVMSGVVVDLVSYYAAYISCIAVALVLAIRHRHASELVIAIAVVFVFYATALSSALLRMPGRAMARPPEGIMRWKVIRRLSAFPADADPAITHRASTLSRAFLCQTGIMVSDAATMWVLLHALGQEAAIAGVFASFMTANLLRTFGIVPGGLGVFEAGSVLALRLAGVPLAAALGATLLFRALSFWAPMVPGLVFARQVRRTMRKAGPVPEDASFWSRMPADLFQVIGCRDQGLTAAEAAQRLIDLGPNALSAHPYLTRSHVLLDQLRNPLLLVLFFAAAVSAFTGEWSDAAIVITILLASVGIGYAREYKARAAAEALRSRIAIRSTVWRDGHAAQVPSSTVVPGDVVLLSAGSLIPADGILLESTDLFVSEAALTGESFPMEKAPGLSAADAPLAQRRNALFLGSNVRSGSARMLVVRTGMRTEYGNIARHLLLKPKPTAFEQGIKRFGYMLTIVMLILVAVVFIAHMLAGRPLVETLLFAVALAVGLSPELLPAILSVNLSRGAHLLSQCGVLVRRLNAIENLGSMDVLCTDKTGTLTEGMLRLDGAFDPEGVSSAPVLRLAAMNAGLASGFDNPLDQAIVEGTTIDRSQVRKLGEVPFDFQRKRLAVAVAGEGGPKLIVKGAFHHVLEVCTRLPDGRRLDEAARMALEERYADWSNKGVRVLAVADRPLDVGGGIDRECEKGLAFQGFITFLDRPKEGVAEAIDDLARLGVKVKLISGDNKLVSAQVAGLVGLDASTVLTGTELDRLSDAQLKEAVGNVALFAEVDPDQKEKIIRALQDAGHVVGFLGDGVNDAPALYAADVGLSVDSAVDVAREAADLVLLQRDLHVIRRGIEEGRRTFVNTLKYVLITMSANLGNMLSMAFASLFLPFLPLLAGQILLNNFLSSIPDVGIADDHVDPEDVAAPHRWDIRSIVRFMISFGALSSVFDLLTFIVLLHGLHAGPDLFRTGWFMESLLTELVVAFVVRTRRRFWKSRPGALLLDTSIGLIVLAPLIPVFPGARILGFTPLPGQLYLLIAGIVVLYALSTELLKGWYHGRRSAGIAG